MKFLLAFILAVSICVKLVINDLVAPTDEEIKALWEKYKLKYRLNFNQTVDNQRISIFKENYLQILTHNDKYYKNESDFLLGLNALSFLSHDEYLDFLKYRYIIQVEEYSSVSNQTDSTYRGLLSNSTMPESFNWVEHDVVTPVKEQGAECGGASWSFAAIGVIESLYAIQFKKLKTFSEQHLIDCTYNMRGSVSGLINKGCINGWPEAAFDYIKTNGIVEESLYEYKAKEGYCQANSIKLLGKPRFLINGFENLRFGDEEGIKRILTTVGPVAAMVDGSDLSFKSYSGGVYSLSDCSSSQLNLAVVIVGYGTQDNKDYWLLKGSFGSTWGENGFMKIARNVNMCGISSLVTYAY